MAQESAFLKMGEISGIGNDFLSGNSVPLGGRPHELLEAMAQCAAYHVRHLVDFSRQAFLLKVTCFPVQASPVEGVVALEAKLVGQARDARAYEVTARQGEMEVVASLLIGTKPYDADFDGNRLAPYYQEIFECLMSV